MAERTILVDLRAVDDALAPLCPSRVLDERIDTLLAGRTPRVAYRRVALAGLGACAAAALIALVLTGEERVVVATAPSPPATPAPSPLPPPRSAADALAPSGTLALEPAFRDARQEHETPDQSDALALAEATDGALPLAAPALLPRATQPVAIPGAAHPAEGRAARRDVSAMPGPRDALVARVVEGGRDGEAALEDALVAVRTLKARGDLRGALARVDGLLAAGVTQRAQLALRIERARLLERLGDRAAACASLARLEGDDVDAALARMSCP
ncbi:MAG: hypothetical protein IT383_04185 [Deltaproteobacteria bacterium]|nr:hypothetical protein [Deltaproteobacteria bacterium]